MKTIVLIASCTLLLAVTSSDTFAQTNDTTKKKKFLEAVKNEDSKLPVNGIQREGKNYFFTKEQGASDVNKNLATNVLITRFVAMCKEVTKLKYNKSGDSKFLEVNFLCNNCAGSNQTCYTAHLWKDKTGKESLVLYNMQPRGHKLEPIQTIDLEKISPTENYDLVRYLLTLMN